MDMQVSLYGHVGVHREICLFPYRDTSMFIVIEIGGNCNNLILTYIMLVCYRSDNTSRNG